MEYGRAERDIGWGRLTSNTPYQLFPLFHSPDREGLRYQSHQFSFQKIYEYLYNGSPSSLLCILARPSVYWPVNMIRNKCLYACHTVNAVSCLGEKTFLLTPITYILCRVSDPHFFLRIRIQAKIFMRIRFRFRIRILGVSREGAGGKGKKWFFFSFFHVSDDS